MILCYSGKSKISALAIAEAAGGDINIVRDKTGDINWGRYKADTKLNPDISNCTNKRIMRELFQQNNVSMPKLVSQDDLPEFLMDKSVVGRPDKHSKGRGYWLCHSMRDVEKALKGTKKKHPATHFMEYVESDHEYRVHIFRGKSIRISEKKFYIDDNGKQDYTTIKPTGEVKHVRKAAKQAIKALSLDFGAVDILATDKDCWVLEVNAAPGLGGTMPKLYSNTFKKWFERKKK